MVFSLSFSISYSLSLSLIVLLSAGGDDMLPPDIEVVIREGYHVSPPLFSLGSI